jgi:drug/metabolite transporter (DMT)-like permease
VGAAPRIDALGAVLLVGLALLMGMNQSLIKIVNEGLAPAFQAGMRSACAFPPLLAYVLIARRRLSLRDGSFWPGVLAGLFFAVEFQLLFRAVEFTTVNHTAVLLYTMPVWLAIAAHVLLPGERLTPRRLLGLGLALAGVALALGRSGAAPGPAPLLGDLMCLGAAGCWAGIALLARTTRLARATAEMQLLYQLAVSAPVLLVLAPLQGPLVRDLQPPHLGIFAFQVIGVVCIGFGLWFWVLKRYPASDVAAYAFLTPFFGVLFSWLLLGEAITLPVVGALILVAIGIALVTWRPRAG